MLRLELVMDMGREECLGLKAVIDPDNGPHIRTECIEKGLKIEISDLKETSIYSLIDDILRSYEVFRKISVE